MPIEEILKLRRARPFVPFRVHVMGGTTYDVLHPELLMPGAGSIMIGTNSNPALPYYEPGRTNTVSLLSISRLEPLPPVKISGNGKTT